MTAALSAGPQPANMQTKPTQTICRFLITICFILLIKLYPSVCQPDFSAYFSRIFREPYLSRWQQGHAHGRFPCERNVSIATLSTERTCSISAAAFLTCGIDPPIALQECR